VSHFSVLVCLPEADDFSVSALEKRLTDVMAPWDENREVDEYRDYETGAAADHWSVKSSREAGLISAEVPSWADVVAAHNARYGSDSERLYLDEEGRAYNLTTRNPEAKWDYWRIGGRWRGYFHVAQRGPGVVYSDRSWDSPAEDFSPDRCDGGRKRQLNFESMRADAAVKANERYDRWEEISAYTPPARAWADVVSEVEVGTLTIEQARNLYHNQPRIRAAKSTKLDHGWGECVVSEFLPGRDEYIAEARLGAVPGYALVTLEGQWLAPGRMGWFGMSSDESGDRNAYRIAANRYLEDLAPDRIVVVLDCHI
jgi:hypothetical protein